MNLKILGMALSVAATFGLMACDNSSSSNGGVPSCKVTTDANSVTLTSSLGGQSMTEKAVIEGDYVIKTTTYKGISKSEVQEQCNEMKSYRKGLDVTCGDNSVTVKGYAEGITVADLKKLADEECEDMRTTDYSDDDEDFDEEDF